MDKLLENCIRPQTQYDRVHSEMEIRNMMYNDFELGLKELIDVLDQDISSDTKQLSIIMIKNTINYVRGGQDWADMNDKTKECFKDLLIKHLFKSENCVRLAICDGISRAILGDEDSDNLQTFTKVIHKYENGSDIDKLYIRKLILYLIQDYGHINFSVSQSSLLIIPFIELLSYDQIFTDDILTISTSMKYCLSKLGNVFKTQLHSTVISSLKGGLTKHLLGSAPASTSSLKKNILLSCYLKLLLQIIILHNEYLKIHIGEITQILFEGLRQGDIETKILGLEIWVALLHNAFEIRSEDPDADNEIIVYFPKLIKIGVSLYEYTTFGENSEKLELVLNQCVYWIGQLIDEDMVTGLVLMALKNLANETEVDINIGLLTLNAVFESLSKDMILDHVLSTLPTIISLLEHKTSYIKLNSIKIMGKFTVSYPNMIVNTTIYPVLHPILMKLFKGEITVFEQQKAIVMNNLLQIIGTVLSRISSNGFLLDMNEQQSYFTEIMNAILDQIVGYKLNDMEVGNLFCISLNHIIEILKIQLDKTALLQIHNGYISVQYANEKVLVEGFKLLRKMGLMVNDILLEFLVLKEASENIGKVFKTNQLDGLEQASKLLSYIGTISTGEVFDKYLLEIVDSIELLLDDAHKHDEILIHIGSGVSDIVLGSKKNITQKVIDKINEISEKFEVKYEIMQTIKKLNDTNNLINP